MVCKIVGDSCCDLNEEIRQQMNISIAPLTIEIDGTNYRDDENLDTDKLLREMKNSKNRTLTACPSPQDFIDKYKGDESIFVVTLSSQLSGTYKSAELAKDMYLEDNEKKNIYVFDSCSASAGETLISLKINELIEEGYKEEEIVEKVSEFIKGMKTFFVLESLDNLVKAGRISPLIAKVSNVLSMRLIMKATDIGTIELHEKVIGAKKTFRRFVEIIGEKGTHLEDKILTIAHCNCPDKALKFKEEVEKRYNFKNIVIVKTAGISTVYANDGGMVIAF